MYSNPDDMQRVRDYKKVQHEIEHIENRDSYRNRKLKYAELGLCGQCRLMHGETTQYGTKRYFCYAFNRPRKLSSNDPIIDCTDYEHCGTLPLGLLMNMAIPIEAKVSRPIGFITDEDECFDTQYGLNKDPKK